jgi:hypothetical protein
LQKQKEHPLLPAMAEGKEAMGTPETHKGFDLVRLKGSLEQARVKVDEALPALVHAHQLVQQSQDTGLTDELLTAITALRHIQTTLGSAATKPLEDTGEPRKSSVTKGE